MNDYLRPEEEKELARKIGKALQTPEDEPSARISPAAIEARLRGGQNTARPKARPVKKGWIAATASLAACAAALLLIVLIQPFRQSGCTGPACLPLSESEQPESVPGSEESASASTDGGLDTVPDSDLSDESLGENTAVDETYGDNSIQDDNLSVGLPQATQATKAPQAGGSSQKGEAAPTQTTAAVKATTPNSTAIWRVSETEAAALLAQGAVLIDVRDAQAFASGHLDGAVNLPLASLAEQALPYDKAAVLLLYGSTASESEEAARLLAAQGYTQPGSLGAFSSLTLPTAG